MEAFMGLETIGITPHSKGKVREIMDLGDNLLLVATDRISAFDHVMPTGIPGRGAVLGSISAFWFRGFDSVMPTHFISDDPVDFPSELTAHAMILKDRAMLVRKAERIDVECIIRGYLTGSGYAMYKKTGEINGIKLPEGMSDFDQIPEPMFTPTTKADEGHDEPMTYTELVDQVGEDMAAQLKRVSLEIYSRGASYALKSGIIIADTKFEFGIIDGKLTLIDEVLTPDSSRFWPLESWGPGKKPTSLDKQFLRDYLLETGWDRNSPPPELPAEIVAKTTERYLSAREHLTGGQKQPAW